MHGHHQGVFQGRVGVVCAAKHFHTKLYLSHLRLTVLIVLNTYSDCLDIAHHLIFIKTVFQRLDSVSTPRQSPASKMLF
jgi:hypothetical protein